MRRQDRLHSPVLAFPLPFGRGEGQGEGWQQNTPTKLQFPPHLCPLPRCGGEEELVARRRDQRHTPRIFP